MPANLFLLLQLTLSFDLSSTCSSSKYYDTSLMSCSTCPDKKVPSSDSLSCICEEGKIKKYESGSSFSCESCSSASTVPSSDQTHCLTCPGGTISNNRCYCNYKEYEVAYEGSKNQDGSTSTQFTCTTCTQETFAGNLTNECISCQDTKMIRDDNYECYCGDSLATSQDSCVSISEAASLNELYPLNDAIIVTYTDLQSGNGINERNLTDSDTFNYFYLKAVFDCYTYNDIKACQQLANLCVLQLYNLRSTVCKAYNYIANLTEQNPNITDPGARANMAWIYYENSPKDVIKKDKLDMKITFDPDDDTKTNVLQFRLASFHLNGTFIGFENLTDQLILCPHSYKVGKYYRTFGTNVDVSCSLDLSVYVSSEETKFYELYLLDGNDTLVDVPILIENFKDENSEFPNQKSDDSKWRLVRRFFIYDNVSGKQGADSYKDGKTTSILQYMKEATLKFTLVNDQDQKIFVPLLILKYRARTVIYIDDSDSTDQISFKSQYTMNTSRFWRIALGVFIGMNILVLLITLARVYLWTKNNPSAHFRHSYTSKLIIQGLWYMSGTWSFIIFWFLLGITAYWFIFYKLQYHVYALVPPSDTYQYNYLPFVVVFSIVFVLQFIWVVYIILSQSSHDIIFIDREHPQNAFKPGVDKIAAALFKDQNHYRQYISAWRTLMVANEFAELQSKRYVYIELTLFFLLFFLKGVSWEDLARAQPAFEVDTVGINLIPMNMILRFFLTSFLFIIISYVQLVLRKVLSTWFPTPTQNFIDLCIVSNISIIILDDRLHGYYIHGVTPLAKADMALEELHLGLSEEKLKEGHKKSLLVPDEEDLYTFEIYIPFDMRMQYDNIMQKAKDDQMFNKKNENVLKIEKTRFKLNESFKAFFEPEIRNLRSFVFDKTSLQRMLNMPPTDMSAYKGSAFFYKDPAMSFEKVLFLGREFSMLLMDLLVFDLLDIAVGNSLVSALTTYLFSKAVEYVRFDLGERNIAEKTFVDRRFII